MYMFKYLFSEKPRPSKSNYNFRLRYSFGDRRQESLSIIKKYKNKVPIIVEKSDQSDIKDIDKHKFLFRRDSVFGDIVTVVRKRLGITSSQHIYFYIDNIVVPNISDNIGDLYKKYRDKDMFLYITYSSASAV